MEAAEHLFRETLGLRQKLNLADEARSWMLLAGLQALGASKLRRRRCLCPGHGAAFGGPGELWTFWMYSSQPSDLEIRAVNALAPISELAWQFQANGQYASSDRLMSVALTAADKWLKPDDLHLVRLRKLAACCAYADGQRPLALKLLQQANDTGFRYLTATTWPYSYVSTTESVVRLQEDGTFTASFGTTEELAQELIDQKGYAFDQQLEKRRLLARAAVLQRLKRSGKNLSRNGPTTGTNCSRATWEISLGRPVPSISPARGQIRGLDRLSGPGVRILSSPPDGGASEWKCLRGLYPL